MSTARFVVAIDGPAGAGKSTIAARLASRFRLLNLETGGFTLAVTLTAHLPGVDKETAEQLVKETHEVCPYSNATRGNIEVTLATTV